MVDIHKYVRTPHIRGSRLQHGDHDLEAVPFEDLRGKHLVVEEKLDGCVSGDTLVQTLELGEISISRLVNEKLDVHVLGRDLLMQEDIYVQVQNRFRHDDVQIWYEIEVENIVLRVTGNHLFYLPELRCWRRADELSEDDVVLIEEKKDGNA